MLPVLKLKLWCLENKFTVWEQMHTKHVLIWMYDSRWIPPTTATVVSFPKIAFVYLLFSIPVSMKCAGMLYWDYI